MYAGAVRGPLDLLVIRRALPAARRYSVFLAPPAISILRRSSAVDVIVLPGLAPVYLVRSRRASTETTPQVGVATAK